MTLSVAPHWLALSAVSLLSTDVLQLGSTTRQEHAPEERPAVLEQELFAEVNALMVDEYLVDEAVGCLLRYGDKTLGLIDGDSLVFLSQAAVEAAEAQGDSYAYGDYDSELFEVGLGPNEWVRMRFSSGESKWETSELVGVGEQGLVDYYVVDFSGSPAPAPVPVLDALEGRPEPGTRVWLVGRDWLQVDRTLVASGTVMAEAVPDPIDNRWFVELDEPIASGDEYTLNYGLVLDAQGRAIGAIGDTSDLVTESAANGNWVYSDELSYRRIGAFSIDETLNVPSVLELAARRDLGGFLYAIDATAEGDRALVTGSESFLLNTADWTGPASSTAIPNAYLGACHPNGSRLALWRDEGLKLLDLAGGFYQDQELLPSTNDLEDLRFCPSGRRLLALDSGGPLIECSLESGTRVHWDDAQYASFDFLATSRLMVAGGNYGELDVMLSGYSEPVRRHQVHDYAQVWPIAAHPRRPLAAFGLVEENALVVLDVNIGEQLCRVDEFGSVNIQGLAWLPDGRHLAVALGLEYTYEWEGEEITEVDDCHVELWDLADLDGGEPRLIARSADLGDLPWELVALGDGRVIAGTRAGNLFDFGRPLENL